MIDITFEIKAINSIITTILNKYKYYLYINVIFNNLKRIYNKPNFIIVRRITF